MTEPLEWHDGTRMTADELRAFAVLRDAGCRCALPLLGERPEVGPQALTGRRAGPVLTMYGGRPMAKGAKAKRLV